MALAPGTRLGPYEIQSQLGAGGMGEVYRARDTRLSREVAVKVMPESFAQDTERLHRFEQESRAVATLNHPNITGIYDVGTQNGAPYLVMELLEGESLRTVLEHGALSQRKVIDYGVQMAQGLAAAHEKGIIHRDLKPENLFITKDGRAKILDFGLAKLAGAQNEAMAGYGATMTSAATAAGVVMGTARYMAPEQVRGEAADARTDIFALGAVLFEMISGRELFHRETVAETMTAVLKEDVPEMDAAVSPALDRIVRRCLEKSPDQRFQSAKDLSFALGVLSGAGTTTALRAAQAAPRKPPVWIWPVMALLVTAVALGVRWLTPSAPKESRMEFAIPVPGEVSHLAISADGKMLAFISPDDKTGAPMLFVQRVGEPDATEMAGTEGASYPFWSPDDAYVAFFANSKLEKVSPDGGTPKTITRVSFARGGSWGSKNVIVYAQDTAGPLWRVNADGSDARVLTERQPGGEDSHRWPLFLPDGEHFLYLAADFTGDTKTGDYLYLSSLSRPNTRIALVHAQSNPGYVQGHLLYVDEKKSLLAVALDPSKGVSGDAQVIAPTVGFIPSVRWGAFAAANNGTVIYSVSALAARSVLTWYGRDGKALSHVGEPGVQANPMLSPDGQRVALDITDLREKNMDVWIQSLSNGTSTRFTFNPAEETTPVWSRDGKQIAFRTVAESGGVLVKAADGMHPDHRITKTTIGSTLKGLVISDVLPNSWSPDDKQIVCSVQLFGGTQGTVLALIPSTGGDLVPLLNTTANEEAGQISPDGRWLAYASSESGDWEVYVTTFPAAQGKWQISRGGGTEPRWRGDGKELYYLNPRGKLMAATVDARDGFSSGTPVELFQVRGRAPISSTDLFTYDVAKDGQRFLVNQYVKPDNIVPLTIVQHALAEPVK